MKSNCSSKVYSYRLHAIKGMTDVSATYRIENICKTYNRQTKPANNDISLTIHSGEFFGLLGDNGAGKTTLVRQMANLLVPTSGQIWLFDQLITPQDLYTAKTIGYMSQNGNALNSVTVKESLYFASHLRGKSRQDARAERDRLIERLSLGSFADKPVSRLSGGQQKLALLATTLAATPSVLILDEPTNELSPQNRIMVWELLQSINREYGTTIILVTHNVLEVERVIQRVGIMKDGKLVAVGRPGVLKSELNQQLKLEVIFTPDHAPPLPQTYQPVLIDNDSGRWMLMIEHDCVQQYLAVLLNHDGVEDFQLRTATLEDLYMSVIKESE